MELLVRTVPAHDTGIGREAGFANDLELIEVLEARERVTREQLTPAGLEQLERAEQALEAHVLGFDPS